MEEGRCEGHSQLVTWRLIILAPWDAFEKQESSHQVFEIRFKQSAKRISLGLMIDSSKQAQKQCFRIQSDMGLPYQGASFCRDLQKSLEFDAVFSCFERAFGSHFGKAARQRIIVVMASCFCGAFDVLSFSTENLRKRENALKNGVHSWNFGVNSKSNASWTAIWNGSAKPVGHKPIWGLWLCSELRSNSHYSKSIHSFHRSG